MLFKYTCKTPFIVDENNFANQDDTLCIKGNKVTNLTSKQSKKLSDLDKDSLKKLCLFISDSEIVIPEDKVNHPSHYTWLKKLCGIEVIDITRHLNFDLGNAIKYILRCGHKEELGYSNKEKTIEDLKKAIFYLDDEIKRINAEKK